jgi:hypothetical protein
MFYVRYGISWLSELCVTELSVSNTWPYSGSCWCNCRPGCSLYWWRWLSSGMMRHVVWQKLSCILIHLLLPSLSRLWNVGHFVPDYIAQYPRRQISWYLSPWEPKMSLKFSWFSSVLWVKCLHSYFNLGTTDFVCTLSSSLLIDHPIIGLYSLSYWQRR